MRWGTDKWGSSRWGGTNIFMGIVFALHRAFRRRIPGL